MPTIDQIAALARFALAGDQDRVTGIIQQMIAHEIRKNNSKAAQRLEAILNKRRIVPLKIMEGLVERKPGKRLTDLILTAETLTEIHHLVEEHKRATLLLSRGLEPRHKILLTGPPGNGKTSLAEAIAAELGLRLCVLDYARVIGSYLGETASRLKQVFDFASQEPCVLFFDEFDTIGKERGDGYETGEIKRVVASLLLFIDDLPPHAVVICATNHPEMLDRAAGRRFDLCLKIDQPSQGQAEAFVDSLEKRYGFDLKPLKTSIPIFSFSDIEKRCLDFMRDAVLNSAAEKCA